jgi:CubicO group peptidase (beta-lactamase class C family)
MTKALPIAGSQTPPPPSTAVTVAPTEFRPIRARLLDRVRCGDVPSFAIGAVRGQKVIWEETVGWADREANAPATAETLYPVASVSKSITATGTLALVVQGKLRAAPSVNDAKEAWVCPAAGIMARS